MIQSVVLRNRDRFVDLVRLRLSDAIRSPARNIDPYDHDRLHGVFQVWGGAFLAIFTITDRVFFACECHILPIEEMRFEVSGPLEAREFTAWREGVLLCHPTDSVHEHGYIEGDPTAFVDMEDFDFGLYAQRVAAQVQREAL